MDFLARHRQVVPLEALAGGQRPRGRPAVAICFDDGYRNVLANAVPVLARHGFASTVFVPTRWIGATNTWDEAKDCFPLDTMSGAELREAEQRGMSVESHGHQHLDLTTVDPAAVADDLRQSIRVLGAVLGHPPRYLAYPYGGQSVGIRQVAEGVGFEAAFGFNQRDAGRFGRERVSLDGSESRLRLRLKTSAGYLARRHSRWGELAGLVARRTARRATHG